MRTAVMIGLLGSLALPVATSAQDQCSVPREDVKTWAITLDGKEYEAHPATPSYEGTTGLFHLPTAYTLPRKKLSVSLFRDNLDRDPKDEDISVHGVTLGYGATDRLELFGSFGLQNRLNSDALSQPGFVNDYPFVRTPWETGAGDLKLGLKYKLLDDYLGDGVGLALRGLVKLGTADENKGLGTGKTSFGADVVLSKSLGRAADIHAALGYQFNGDPDDPLPVDLGNALKWGIGLNIPACRIFQVQAELTGASYQGAAFDQTSPVDLVVGPVFWIKGFFIRPAISRNLAYDDRGLDSGGRSSTGYQLSIGYHPGSACCEIAAPAPPPPPPPPANRPPTATCEAARSTLAPGESVGLRAISSDPDGDSLSYAWTADAGRITGSGPNVSLDCSGVTAPSSVTASVRVSDGRGGTAEATCSVRVAAAERRAEPITCESTGFALNLARLNNIDKACLDDVAARLRQDPRSRVIVVGHADSAERRPDVLSRQRAEAVKTYLVRDRGVEEARVTARGVGATRPREPGSSRGNRRVELIFVPDGAVPPEQR
jgi:outer membrane protein OmpA-like peptidoglycan-associated protein